MVRLCALLLSVAAVAFSDATAGDVSAVSAPNRFNRLLTPQVPSPPLALDGIHDPLNPGMARLHQPKKALQPLDLRSSNGYLTWLTSLTAHNTKRYIFAAKQVPHSVPDTITMKVEGSMPDVAYPHKRHAEWLACSSCHPDIFVARKNANPMTMSDILSGRRCGVCHGKVAFAIDQCRRCH